MGHSDPPLSWVASNNLQTRRCAGYLVVTEREFGPSAELVMPGRTRGLRIDPVRQSTFPMNDAGEITTAELLTALGLHRGPVDSI